MTKTVCQDFLVAVTQPLYYVRHKPRENTTKPSKSEVFESIESISKLWCQEVTEFHSSKTIILPHSFQVSHDLFPSESKYKEYCNTEFIISSIKIGFSHCNVIDNMPTWAAIKSLISDSNIPITQVGFLPFIPKPVTEHATVYTAMINFVKVLEQLDQKSIPIFCDEDVCQIVVDIYIKCPEKFKALVPYLVVSIWGNACNTALVKILVKIKALA